MSDWPHEAIRAASLRYIRRHIQSLPEWRFTCLDSLHPKLSGSVEFTSGELPVVTCFIDWSRWYVISSARIVGRYRDSHFDVAPLTVEHWEWGDFKHHGRAEVEVAQLVLRA